jgi:hypothetical protein
MCVAANTTPAIRIGKELVLVSRFAEGVGSRFRERVFHVVNRCPKTTPDPAALLSLGTIIVWGFLWTLCDATIRERQR